MEELIVANMIHYVVGDFVSQRSPKQIRQAGVKMYPALLHAFASLDTSVKGASMLMILCDLQMPQTEGSEALVWPGKKACVFTLRFVLLESFSGTPCTCMLKKNSRTLSQDLGLINPDQRSKIKSNLPQLCLKLA